MNSTAIALSILALGSMAHADLVWDESADGDLSSVATSPTAISVASGSNVVSGRVQASGDTRDYFTFNIPSGLQLTGIFLLDYTDVVSGGNGDRGFIHIDDGTSSVVPSASTIASVLGGSHLDRAIYPNSTDNLLVALSGAPQGGSGFTVPLGPGDYTMNVQQTGAELTAYSLDLVLEATPPPGCAADLDGDGDTDVLDFSVFAANFGTDVPPGTSGDFDNSGLVDIFDFAIFASDLGCSD